VQLSTKIKNYFLNVLLLINLDPNNLGDGEKHMKDDRIEEGFFYTSDTPQFQKLMLMADVDVSLEHQLLETVSAIKKKLSCLWFKTERGLFSRKIGGA